MKRHFITGLALLLPLAMTIWIIDFIIDLLTDPFLDISKQILSVMGLNGAPDQLITVISKILILVSLISFIFCIGSIASRFFFKFLMQFGDSILHKIPIVRTIYKTSQELIQTLFSEEKKTFKQVVLVPFPNSSSRSIGFLTRDDIQSERVAVFIPTAPNPTSGYLVMYKPDQIVPIEMSVENALRYTVSCGVLIDSKLASSDFSPIKKEL